MSRNILLGSPDKIKSLSDRLSKSERVKRYDSDEEPQSWTLAYNFSELEESFRKFVEGQLPKLLSNPISDKQIDDTLHEIGEEFRHILYHLKNSEYYNYLWPDESNGSQ